MRSKSAYLLSEEPYVVTGSFDLLEEIPGGQREVTVLFHNPGWIHPISALRWKKKAVMLRKRRPARIIFFANERLESLWMRLIGERAYWMNQNLHIRENLFLPRPEGWPRRYDAVYSAQMEPFKRIHLAAAIRRLYVLTYKSGQTAWKLSDAFSGLEHADHNRTFIGEAGVRQLYWSAGCGLALSLYEGAMWAAAEYLMCGVPIVSTYSRGGRALFKDDYYWFQAKASQSAVAARVADALARNCDPLVIRARALEKIRKWRQAFVSRLSKVTGREVANYDEETERIWGGEQGIFQHRVPSDDV